MWQLPHFLALAVLYREDYARAKFPMLPIVEAGGGMTARQTALSAVALLPISLFPTQIGVAGPGYFYSAMVLTTVFFLIAVHAAFRPSVRTARNLFRASVLYLPVLLMLLVCNRPPFIGTSLD
jgi:protoheme IX farnesyltransferase